MVHATHFFLNFNKYIVKIRIQSEVPLEKTTLQFTRFLGKLLKSGLILFIVHDSWSVSCSSVHVSDYKH